MHDVNFSITELNRKNLKIITELVGKKLKSTTDFDFQEKGNYIRIALDDISYEVISSVDDYECQELQYNYEFISSMDDCESKEILQKKATILVDIITQYLKTLFSFYIKAKYLYLFFIDNFNFVITELSRKKLKDITKKKKVNYIRIVVDSGGCSGFQYDYVFDSSVKQGDFQMILDYDVTVLIDSFSKPFITNSILDHVNDLSGESFKMFNPNATKKCGCGKSFSIL